MWPVQRMLCPSIGCYQNWLKSVSQFPLDCVSFALVGISVVNVGKPTPNRSKLNIMSWWQWWLYNVIRVRCIIWWLVIILLSVCVVTVLQKFPSAVQWRYSNGSQSSRVKGWRVCQSVGERLSEVRADTCVYRSCWWWTGERTVLMKYLDWKPDVPSIYIKIDAYDEALLMYGRINVGFSETAGCGGVCQYCLIAHRWQCW